MRAIRDPIRLCTGWAVLFACSSSLLSASPASATWVSDSGTIIVRGSGGNDGISILPDDAGGVFLSWLDTRPNLPNSDSQLWLVRTDRDRNVVPGWPQEGIRLSEGERSAFYPTMLPDGEGGIVLFWLDIGPEAPGPDLNRVFIRRVRSDGTFAPGHESGPTQLKPFSQRNLPHVTRLEDGTFIVSSTLGGVSAPSGGVLVTRVDADGAPAAGWPDSGVVIANLQGPQGFPQTVPDGHGGCYLFWQDGRNLVETRLYAIRLLANATPSPDWPADGREMGFPTSSLSDYSVLPDRLGFLLSIFSRALACDTTGSVRAGWPNPAITQNVLPNGPLDRGNAHISGGDEALYVLRNRYRNLNLSIQAEQRMLVRVDSSGRALAPWPDTGVVINHAVENDTFGIIAIQRGAGGLYLIFGGVDVGGRYWKGGFLRDDLTWGPGWPEGGRPLSRTLQSGPFTVTSEGMFMMAFAADDGAGGPSIRLFKMGVDGPVPTLASVAVAEVEGDRARIEWHVVDPPASPLIVERSLDGVAWEIAGSPDWVASDRVRFEDGGIAPGDRRAFRLAWTEGGQEHHAGLAWIARPSSGRLELESARHVSSEDRLELMLSAESPDPIDVRVLDVQGRLSARRTLARSTQAQRTLSIRTEAWGPGLYFVRIAQGDVRIHSRVTVLR